MRRARLMRRTCQKLSAVGAALALLLVVKTAAHAISRDEYRQLIAECRHAAAQEYIPPSRVADLRTRLSAAKTVTDDSGKTILLDTTSLQDALSAKSSASKEAAAARFAALEALLTPSETAGAKGDPRTQASQVLAGKEFITLRQPRKTVKSVIPNWWIRFTRWAKETTERITQWLDKLFRNRHAPKTPNLTGVEVFVKFFQFLLYFVLAVAGIVALYLLARTASARGWLKNRRKRKREVGSDLEVDLSGEGIVDPLGNARALAAKGAYRDAVRMAYIASLRQLRENGLLVLEPNKTNWEYQRDLRRRSLSAFDTLLPATRLFDRLWYGRHSGTMEEFDAAVRVHDALRDSVSDAVSDSASESEPEAPAQNTSEGSTRP